MLTLSKTLDGIPAYWLYILNSLRPAGMTCPVCRLVLWRSSQSSLSTYHVNTLLSFSPNQGVWICSPFSWNILHLLIPQVPSLSLNAISSNTLTIVAKESHATACIIFHKNTFLSFLFFYVGLYRIIIRQ